MSLKVKRVIKVVAFLLIAALLLGLLNFIAQPVWSDKESYGETYGFYEEPENTLETVFLGSSVIYRGITPMELYEKYGICAYNRSTDSQPLLVSYYLLEETYRLHAETLSTVVLDVSMLRKDPDSSWYHKALDFMNFSWEKIHAVYDFSGNFSEFLLNLTPLLSYHERWKSLSDEDFLKFDYESCTYARGYKFTTEQWIDSASTYSAVSTPLCILDESAEDMVLDSTAVKYFEKTVAFCEENDLQLILIKTPTTWDSKEHNAVQTLADSYDLDFLDFNIEPYFSEVGFNLGLDVYSPDDITNLHLNYYGASKLTEYLGNYLSEECGVQDVRGDEKYSFMEEELEEYHRYIIANNLNQFTDPYDYIEYVLNQGNYTIFISVKEEAAKELSQEQRECFASIGLSELADLGEQDAYLAVIENGNVLTEQTQRNPGENNPGNAIYYEGKLTDGATYFISSGAYYLGNVSSIKIDNEECSKNGRGLNIVLYDNLLGKIVDSAIFDTHSSSERSVQDAEKSLTLAMEKGTAFSGLEGTDRILYQYDRACENDKKTKIFQQEIKEGGISFYLNAFLQDENIDIFITAQGNAARVLNADSRKALADIGLTELSQLMYKNTYLAIIDGGKIIYEKRGAEGETLSISSLSFLMTSSGTDTDDASSVMIDGVDYCEAKNGINVVVYDKITESVIDSITYDIRNATSALSDGDIS